MPAGRFRVSASGGGFSSGPRSSRSSALLTFDPKLYVNGDNIDYMNLAKAVTGRRPLAEREVPAALPVAARDSAVRLRACAAAPEDPRLRCFYLGSGILLMRRARSLFGTPWGEPIAWIAITLVPVLEFGHYVMSEIPYLFFSLLALEAVERVGGAGEEGCL